MILNCILLSEGAAKGVMDYLVSIGCTFKTLYPDSFSKGKYSVNLSLRISNSKQSCTELCKAINLWLSEADYKYLFLQVLEDNDGFAFHYGNIPLDKTIVGVKPPNNVIPFRRPLKAKHKENVF